MVGTFTQPDFESQGGTAYKTNLDNSISVISDWGAKFAPHEQTTPDMTIQVDAGTLFSGTALTVLAALSTGTITAPSTNPRKDIVYLDTTGGGGSPLVYIGVQTGSEAASPVDPTVASGLIPVARITLATSTTAISNSLIDDLRGVIWDKESFGIFNVVEDTSPQLGGNLDLNGNVITGLEIGTDVQAYDATEYSPEARTITAYTGTALNSSLTHEGGVVTMSNASANVFTIEPNATIAHTDGAQIDVVMLGAGVTSVTGGTGVTLNDVSAGTGVLTRYQATTLVRISSDVWVAPGLGTVS